MDKTYPCLSGRGRELKHNIRIGFCRFFKIYNGPNISGVSLVQKYHTCLTEPESAAMLEEVYSGCWGFNGILSMSALSCVFLAFNRASIGLGLVNVASTVIVQFGLRALMTLQVLD